MKAIITVYFEPTLAIAIVTGLIGIGAATAYLGTCAASGAYIGYGLIS